jgi:hypothetical protein
MRIDEVENSSSLDPNKLMGLVNFLSGRADDENAQKQISTDAFISAARSLGFPISEKKHCEHCESAPFGQCARAPGSTKSHSDKIQRCCS